MKTLLCLLSLLLLPLRGLSADSFIHALGDRAVAGSDYLVRDVQVSPGVWKNYRLLVSDMQAFSTNGLGSAAWYPFTAFDVIGAGTTAAQNVTNGYVWGYLYDSAGTATSATNDLTGAAIVAKIGAGIYDASGAALNVTNGYVWGYLYDSAGTATSATNDLTGAAIVAKIGAGIYDASGAALNATQALALIAHSGLLTDAISGDVAITNHNVAAVSLTNGANLFSGIYFQDTNAALTTTLTAGLPYTTNMAGAVALANFAGIPNNKVWSIYLFATNTSGGNLTMTFPSGCRGMAGLGLAVPPVYYVTNGAYAIFQVHGWGNQVTNVSWEPH